MAEKGQPTSADPVAAPPNYSGRSALRPFNWREIFKTGCALIGISRHAVHARASYQASPAQRVMAGYSDSYDEMDTEESESTRSILLQISQMIGKSLGKKKKLSSAGHSSTTTTTTTTASDDEGICFLSCVCSMCI